MKARVERLFSLLAPEDAQAAVLLTKPENIRYFSGYSGEGALILSAGGCAIVTDFRYTEQAAKEAPDFAVHMTSSEQKPLAVQRRALEGLGCRKVLLEGDHLTYSAYKKLENAFAGLTIALLEGQPGKARRVKDAAELALMERAEHIVDETFSHMLGVIRPGLSELDLVAELEYRMRRLGGEGAAFSSIVCSGPNTSLPHARPGNRRICSGDLVTMDFGASLGGLCSDFTRTVAVGHLSDELRRVYETVRTAQMMALAAVRPGVQGSAVDAVARAYIDQAGYQGRFGHGLGHGVGLLIHEEPSLGSTSTDVLEEGHVVTVEPGIYLPGIGGVRIEDMVAVTKDGCRNFAASTKELIIV